MNQSGMNELRRHALVHTLEYEPDGEHDKCGEWSAPISKDHLF